MTLETLSAFFGWLTVVHLAVFSLTATLILILQNVAAELHARMFAIPEEEVRRVIYSWLGTYKLMIFVTALVPWLALQLM